MFISIEERKRVVKEICDKYEIPTKINNKENEKEKEE